MAAAGAAVSSTPDVVAQFNHKVDAIAQSGNHTFVGGQFTRAGTPTPFGTDVSATDGSANSAFAQPNADVQQAVSDGSGGWYIAGDFTAVGGVARNHVAHLLANGSVDSAFDPNIGGENAIDALLLSGATLYIGGSFATVQGAARADLAAVSATTGAPTGFTANLNAPAEALALSGTGPLYVGGSFTKVGTVTRNRLAAVDAATGALVTTFDANVDPTALQANTSSVLALTLSGSDLYAAGGFTSVNKAPNAVTRPGLVAVNAMTGVVDSSFNAGITGADGSDAPIDALAASGSAIYLGGTFTSLNSGSVVRNRIAAVSSATGTATSFDPNLDGGVETLSVSGTTVYAGGTFDTVNGGTTRHKAAAFDSSGTATAFDPDVDNTVAALAVGGARAYLGGVFEFVGASTIHDSLAELNSDGTVDQAFDPDVLATAATADVDSIVASGTKLYVAGNFGSISGVARSNIAALDSTTGVADATFNPGANGTVRGLALSGSTVYAGGDFTTAGGASRDHVAGFDATSGAVTGFDPGVVGTGFDTLFPVVDAIAASDSEIYVGGNFTTAGGATRNGLAAFDPTTGALDASFDPNMNDSVVALALSGGTLYAGGVFTTVGGASTNNLAAVDATTGALDTAFAPNAGGTVRSLALGAGALYVGQQFGAALGPGNSVPGVLAAVDPTSGSLDTDFAPNVVGGFPGALFASASQLYAGGNFTTVGGASELSLARFTGETAAPPVPVTGAASAVTNTGATLAGTVNPSGAATTYTFEYGPTTAFGSNTPFVSAGAGTSALPESANLTSLMPDTTYFYRLVAKNAGGTSFFGAVLRFNTGPGGAPIVATGAAAGVTTSGATLAGTVDPHGAATVFTFEYGTSFASAGSTSISATDTEPAVDGAQSVSLPISGLRGDTTYYYRLVATNATGATFGALSSFNTGPGGAPIATTGGSTSVTATGAVLAATVNPHGAATVFTFEYGTSFGSAGSTSITAVDTEKAFDGSVPVSLPVAGLAPGTTYLYRVVATNAGGTTVGVLNAFTTAAGT